MKIAIVGAEESKWTEKQKLTAKAIIADKMYGLYKMDYTLISGGCPKGGVDIWAEELADKFRVKKEIFKPDVNQWDDKVVNMGEADFGSHYIYITEKGYKSRNIQIAKTCDVLVCIVPFKKGGYCQHHSPFDLTHLQCGGCWTMKYAKKLGKKVELFVI